MYSIEPIVIVDDDPDDHYIFKKIIGKIGIINKLLFFNNGHEVLHYLKNTAEQPFIIICDINMPVMDGIELRRLIEQDPYLKQKSIPFVFFSTAANSRQIKEAYSLTVQGFFKKEQSFSEAEKTIRLILEYWDKCKHPNSLSPLI